MKQEVQLSIRSLSIPMRVSFKHASATRNETSSVWVEAVRGSCKGLGEGCPRSYVTGEGLEDSLAWMRQLAEGPLREISKLEDLKVFVETYAREIDERPSAWCALELAFLDLFAQEKSQSVEELLGRKTLEGPFYYTAVVSDGSPEVIRKTLQKYFEMGFEDYKFKICGSWEKDRERLQLVNEYFERKELPRPRHRLDANNLWQKNTLGAVDYFSKLDLPLVGIEEPVASRDFSTLSLLSERFSQSIILDESCSRLADLEKAASFRGRWIPNIRVSKMGGLIRSLEVARKVRELGWSAVVGAQVGETSVLTRAALTVAQELGTSLIGQEGAYGEILLERDVVEPVLSFSMKGQLRLSAGQRSASGWGLRPV
jgi:L-alanine-DL-glutamate epimerase-like enolase superfamily enzyme